MPFDPGIILMQYFCLLFSLCVHEAAHAWTADRCGDQTARFMGRVTLDPRKHVDPLGTVVLPLIMMVFQAPYLFGWAKPVPFNLRNLNNMRRDPVLIALAGPISNILIALICAMLLRVVALLIMNGFAFPVFVVIVAILLQMILINLVLALFNVIPLPPLDGHHVLYYFLPQRGKEVLENIGPFGIIIAVLFLSGPWLSATVPALMDLLLGADLKRFLYAG